MKRQERDAIQRSYYASRDRYEKLAGEIRRVFDSDIDPSVPTRSIYTIKHRIKSVDRLLEKITKTSVTQRITPDNYQERVKDILGIRIVCLRLSDVGAVANFLLSLRKERKLHFVCGPEKKQTFILPVNPGEAIPSDLDLQYSGYSSIHYLVRLGKALHPPDELAILQAEIQVRTILEEAWGEIDHKYRYALIRSGKGLPGHVDHGFYNLSAYLQAAALQVEYLCRDVDSLRERSRRRTTQKVQRKKEPETISSPDLVDVPATSDDATTTILAQKLGFAPTPRTLTYILQRIAEVSPGSDDVNQLDTEILSERHLSKFREIYREVKGSEPFANFEERNLDLINEVNYALLAKIQSLDIARAAAVAVLRRRFGLSGYSPAAVID